ncbi:MAG: diguanylate cyclase [Clostridiales bacterium]|nr:diguanylate cyclase [Clostridiales bacterium]
MLFLSYGKREATLYYFKLLSAAIFLWSFFNALLFVIPDPQTAYIFYMLKYIGMAFAPVFIYLHVETLTGRSVKISFRNLSILPLITTVLCMTSVYHPLLNSNMQISGDLATRVILVDYGVWFYVQEAYSYVLFVLAFYRITNIFSEIPQRLRKPFVIITVGVVSVFVINVLVTFKIVITSIEPTLVAAVIMLYLSYFTLFSTNMASIIMTSRERIYFNLTSMLFVLDSRRTIIDCNIKAQELIKKLKLEGKSTRFDDFLDAWMAAGKGRASDYNRDVLTIQIDEQERHYQITRQEVTENEVVQGSFIQIQEITQIYELMRSLENSAFYDALTGIPNRNAYILRLNEWDTASTLPLAIIVADINHLKSINDTYGHILGDELLKIVARIISSCSPDRAGVFRIGGDEFVVMLPNSNEEEIEAVMTTIKAQCESFHHKDFGSPSVAIGGVLRNEMGSDLRELVKQADESMYRDKYDRRKS